MTISQIKAKAKALGIEPENYKKAELIRTIQKTEGSTPCFGAIKDGCVEMDCLWTRDCAKVALSVGAA